MKLTECVVDLPYQSADKHDLAEDDVSLYGALGSLGLSTLNSFNLGVSELDSSNLGLPELSSSHFGLSNRRRNSSIRSSKLLGS